MNNFDVVELLKCSSSLNKNFPNVIFINKFACLLVLLNKLEYVSTICIFHYNTLRNKIKNNLSYHSIPLGSSKNASL